MASDIGPQSLSTPQYFCLWLKLNHLSSRTLQVLTGFIERSQTQCSQVHCEARVSGIPGGGNTRIRTLPQINVCSRMVADVRRRILARKTLPPRYLVGYGSCDDS